MADSAQAPIAPQAAEQKMQDNGPVPLSFPAILRNPGLNNRFAHLRAEATNPKGPSPAYQTRARRRDENEGKRWVRRSENARFLGNPHVTQASKGDYMISPPVLRSTFPEPLPPYLPRSVKVPNAVAPVPTPANANAGRFSLSFKGMRRDLRKAGGRAQFLVQVVEREIVDWLHNGGTILASDMNVTVDGESDGVPIDETGIFEISRTPLQLVWRVSDDSFARYVVHCCARYHEVVSFSKDWSGQRLTYLLRPNVTRPDSYTISGLDTPPVTDLESSSHFDSESDFLSDVNEVSDADSIAGQADLAAISEASNIDDDKWSIIGKTDEEAEFDSGNEAGLEASIASLSIDPDTTIEAPTYPVNFRARQNVWAERRVGRSASSPSRSPVRRPARRPRGKVRKQPGPVSPAKRRTLYEFLYH